MTASTSMRRKLASSDDRGPGSTFHARDVHKRPEKRQTCLRAITSDQSLQGGGVIESCTTGREEGRGRASERRGTTGERSTHCQRASRIVRSSLSGFRRRVGNGSGERQILGRRQGGISHLSFNSRNSNVMRNTKVNVQGPTSTIGSTTIATTR